MGKIAGNFADCDADGFLDFRAQFLAELLVHIVHFLAGGRLPLAENDGQQRDQHHDHHAAVKGLQRGYIHDWLLLARWGGIAPPPAGCSIGRARPALQSLEIVIYYTSNFANGVAVPVFCGGIGLPPSRPPLAFLYCAQG